MQVKVHLTPPLTPRFIKKSKTLYDEIHHKIALFTTTVLLFAEVVATGKLV